MIASGLDSALAHHASPRFALRTATAAAHARVDHLYSRLDLSKADDYARFLLSHAAAFIPIEDALIDAGADALLPGWSSGRRGDRLRADLAALNLPVPAPEAAPVFSGEAATLGGLYVLEGSRLGGAVLARTIGAGLPTAFLNPDATSSWRVFTALLDARLTCAESLERATGAAQAAFAVFERCARATLEPAARAH